MLLPLGSSARFLSGTTPRINWSNPLTNGLIALYLPGVAFGYNLVGKGGFLATVGVPVAQSTPAGAGLFCPNTLINGLLGTTPTEIVNATATASTFWYGTVASGSSAQNADATFAGANNAGGAFNIAFGIQRPRGASAQNAYLAWSDNGTNKTSGNSAITVGPLTALGATFATGGNAILYNNGVAAVTTALGTGPLQFGVGSQILIGNSHSDNRVSPLNGTTNIAAFWNRVLTAQEQAQLAASPFCFLSFPEDEIFATLVGVAAAGGIQFSQTDWPNPSGYPFPAENRTFLWQGNARLVAVPSVIFRPPLITRLWPKDTGAGLRAASDIPPNTLLLDLAGQDKFFGGPGQPPANLDWPNPRGYVPSIDLRTQAGNLLETTLGIVFSPFYQTDWQNPTLGRPYVVSLRTWVDPLKLELLGQDKFFGGPGQPPANLDWPNPRGYVPAIDLRSWLLNLSETTLAPIVVPPFYQTEWPNPRGYIPGVSLKTWTDPVKLNLLGQDKFFGAAGMGPVYDYPNPRGYIPAISLKTWIDPLKLELLGKDKFFGGAGQAPANLDWPVPKGPVYAVSLRSWSNDLLQSTLKPFVQPPFYLTEWPNPRGYIPAIGLKTHFDPAIPTQPSTWVTVTPVSGGWVTVSATTVTWTTIDPVTGLWTTVPIKT